jgi:HNH endonuclease
VRDMRFLAVEGKGWPFCLVPNQKDLLFLVRPLAVRRLKITAAELQELFPEGGPGNKGKELGIRVQTERDAHNLITHVLDKWPRLETQAVEAIPQRTDIGAAGSEMLVKARRGQGVYRSNLEKVEQACRITGVLDRRHLRACHIKPWRDCSDFEKLDGFNGLLLSPHVEHLFEQGYISFSDDGRLLVSRWLNRVVLERWGIAVANQGRPFCAEQRVYLAWHRERVFEQEETGRRRLQ